MKVVTPDLIYTYILQVAGICTAFTVIGAVIIKIINVLRKPNIKQDEKLEEHEKWLNRHNKDFELIDEKLNEYNEYFLRDFKRFDIIESELRLLTRGMLLMIKHNLDGNDINDLQKLEKDITDHLIEK